MIQCAFCQGSLEPGARFCRRCGRLQPTVETTSGALTRLCPNCRRAIPAQARFCLDCGQSLTSASGPLDPGAH